ncbi:MAG: efflux RND transporter permease subunit, partial [Nitrospinota bacterium]
MRIIAFCVRNPVTVMVGVILALLFGAISLASIPMQMTPTVDRPVITVSTEYKGAAPLEVEEEVTKRQEEKLNSVEGLSEMTSVSREDRSSVVLWFDWGANKDIARLDVSEKLALVRRLPDDAERPVIRAVNSDEETPIAWVVVRSRRPINEVREEVDDVIRPRLERLPGVGTVWRFGGQERQVRVTLDYAALSARGISIAQVRDALLRENRNTKGGRIDEGKKRYVVRTVGRFRSLRDLEEVIVAQTDGRPVYLKDVASVRFDHEDPIRHVRLWGEPVIGMGVLRKTGANTVEVMKHLRREIRFINDTLYAGKDIQLLQVYDETDYIYDSVRMVTDNIWYGGTLAVLVLLLFLGSVSTTLVIAFSIPITVVATFIFVYALGRSLNIVSLAGLAFAVGMVVDNAIVVLENIYRHRQKGAAPFEAALRGAQEVWGGILASTLTTMAVFVPVIFVSVEAGQLFRDIAIAIAVAVGLSLIVSVTVIPMLSARWLRVGGRRGRWARLRDGMRFVWAGHLFWRGLLGLHRWLLRGWLRRVAVIVLVVAASLFTAAHFMPPIDYLPQGNRNLFFAFIRTPAGFNLEQQDGILRTLEARFRQPPEVERFFAVVRTHNPIMGIVAKREHSDLPSMRRTLGKLRGLSGGIPGVRVFITQVPLFRRRHGGYIGGTNLEVDIKGDSLTTLERLAAEAQGRIQRLAGVNFVNSSFDLGNPELQVRIDREKAADLGLTAQEVGYVVETMVNGTLAGTFREGGKERDIVLRGSAEEFSRTQDLSRIVL